MAKRRQKQNKKWLYWILILVLLIIAGVVVYFVWDSYFRDKKENARNQENEAVIEKEKDVEKQPTAETTSDETGKKKVEQYEGEDPNLKNELSGVVTYAGVSSGKLMIRVNIDQYLQGGECELVLSRSGATVYSGRVNIIDNASTSTCEGFDVPSSGLGSGRTDITINLNAGGKTGIIKGEVEL